MELQGKNQIGRLRISGLRGHDLAISLRLSRLLNGVDLQSTRVPPAMILIIRQMKDPLPEHIASERGSVRIDSAWERAVQNSLAEMYARAARPGQGAVPTNAEA